MYIVNCGDGLCLSFYSETYNVPTHEAQFTQHNHNENPAPILLSNVQEKWSGDGDANHIHSSSSFQDGDVEWEIGVGLQRLLTIEGSFCDRRAC